jgi:hypothetical protein
MEKKESVALVRALMTEYAVNTGVIGERGSQQRRYLWTDAYAVCNFLGMYHESGDIRDLNHCLQLVENVHHCLGQHRADDYRHRVGWISGLTREEGESHPTCGGLRIGKPHAEPPPHFDDSGRSGGCSLEPTDRHLEWDQDGQYLHYLLQWAHALHRVSQDAPPTWLQNSMVYHD